MNPERPRQFAARARIACTTAALGLAACFRRCARLSVPWARSLIACRSVRACSTWVVVPGCFLQCSPTVGPIREGRGFDASRSAIGLAKVMTGNLNGGTPVSVEYRDATAEWPDRLFDVISMIDVMHHVAPASQAQVIRAAAARLAPGGILIYKDMVEYPRWRAWANRLHDLVLAHQWIHYAPFVSVRAWAEEAGLQLVESGRKKRVLVRPRMAGISPRIVDAQLLVG